MVNQPNDYILGTSLVVQWLRIHLPMQGTRVRAPVREDPTCRGATKPVRHNYWVCALEPVSHNYGAHEPQLLKPAHLEPVLCNEKPPQWEAHAPQRRVARLAAPRESPGAAMKTQHSQKKKHKRLYFKACCQPRYTEATKFGSNKSNDWNKSSIHEVI